MNKEIKERKILKLFRYVIIKGIHHYPLDTWYRMDKYSINSVKYNATLQNMYKNGDKDIEWYMEFKDVVKWT